MLSNGARNGEAILVQVNLQVNGAFYILEPPSENRIRDSFSEARTLPSVFFGYDRVEEFPERHAPLWPQAAHLLTGLTDEQIKRLGGITFYNPRTKEVVWQSPSVPVTSA
jgi:hypothetical protein